MLVVVRGVIAALLLGFAPGFLLERAWFGRTMPIVGLERQVGRVIASLLIVGWLALVLAEFGVFSLWLLGGLVLVFCVACWLVARRHSQPSSLIPHPSSFRSDWLLLLITVIFVVLVARPFEVLRGGLDAGVYANTGWAIARSGGIVQHDPIVAAIGTDAAAGNVDGQHVLNQLFVGGHPERYLASKLRSSGFGITPPDVPVGRVVPQFFHLWPVWIAIFTAVGTPLSGLLATGAAATLGVLLVGLLGRRLAGAWVGVGAAALLALSTPQVWFGRMPISEMLAQALILAGLWAFAHFAAEPGGRVGNWWGWVAGAAFGQLALTRIDSFWAIGPTLLLLGYVAFTRRWRSGYTWLAATLGLLLVHTVLHTLFIARAYFFDTAYARLQDYAITAYASMPFLTDLLRSVYRTRSEGKIVNPQRLAAELVVVALGVGALWLLWRRPRPLLAVEAWVRRHQRPLLLTWVIVLGLAAGYAYLIRPQIINMALFQQSLAKTSLQLQGYIGAPIAVPIKLNPVQQLVQSITHAQCKPDPKPGQLCDPKIAQSQANMVRLGWYLSPLGILLGVWGALRWWRRGLNRCSWLLLVMATAYTLFYIRLLYGTGDVTYIYILRRYVPLVFPAWMLAMAYALFGERPIERRKAEGGRRNALASTFRRSSFVVRPALAFALLAFFAWTGRGVYAHTEYGGAFGQFGALAEKLRPNDVVLVRTAQVRDQADIVVAPLTYLFGRNVLAFKGSNPAPYGEALAAQVARWRGEGREVYLLLGASSGDWRLPGWGIVGAGDWTWRYREYEQPTDHKPSAAGGEQQLTLRLYRVVPAIQDARPAVITAGDTAMQLSGIYRAEWTPAGIAAWTMGEAVVRLPGGTGSQLTLELGSGKRPQAAGPAQVCVSVAPETPALNPVAWTKLGCNVVGSTRQAVPFALPPTPTPQPLLIRLETPTWIPSQTDPDPGDPQSNDGRALGVQFFGASR